MSIARFVWISSLALAASLAPPAPRTASAAATIDATGNILIDGEPRFLHGVYHDSMDATPMRYRDDFRADVRVIADAGFNAIWVSIDPTWDDGAQESLAALDASGLHVISNFRTADAAAVLPHYGEIESLLGLSIGDDFNFPAEAPRHRPAELAATRRAVRQQVEHALAVASGAAHPTLSVAGYADAMDAMGLQCYPIGNTDRNVPGGVAYELEMCDDMLSFAREELGWEYPLLPTLQAFRWDRDGEREPSATELRNMLFTALQFAPAGIFWYSFYDGRQALNEREELWEELSLLSGDVARLESAFLHGRFVKVENPDDPFLEGSEGAWHAAYWELRDMTYLVVTNTDKNSSKLVNIALPERQSMRPFFPRPRFADALRFEGGRVLGAAPPRSVQVYVLTR